MVREKDVLRRDIVKEIPDLFIDLEISRTVRFEKVYIPGCKRPALPRYRKEEAT